MRRTPADLAHVAHEAKRAAVAQRDKDHAVVHERRERRDDGRFLATARCPRGDEHACKLARQRALEPEPAGVVPECLERVRWDAHEWSNETDLPLRGKVAITRGDAKEEGVERGELGGGEDGVVRFRGGVHFGEHVVRERLCDPGHTHA